MGTRDASDSADDDNGKNKHAVRSRRLRVVALLAAGALILVTQCLYIASVWVKHQNYGAAVDASGQPSSTAQAGRKGLDFGKYLPFLGTASTLGNATISGDEAGLKHENDDDVPTWNIPSRYSGKVRLRAKPRRDGSAGVEGSRRSFESVGLRMGRRPIASHRGRAGDGPNDVGRVPRAGGRSGDEQRFRIDDGRKQRTRARTRTGQSGAGRSSGVCSSRRQRRNACDAAQRENAP